MKPIIASTHDKVDALAVKVRDRLYAEKRADVYAIGPGGLHQAVKALAVANLRFREEGSILSFVPEIESKSLVKKEDLIIKLLVYLRQAKPEQYSPLLENTE
jgi:stage V sporulation protein SpoVS